MKKKTIKPTRSQFNILRQICNFIPPHTVSKIARETGAEDKSRTFTPWSHVVSLVYAQLTHSIGLNDVCDSLQLHSGPLSSDSWGDGAESQRPFQCQPGAAGRDGRTTLLAGAGPLGRTIAGVCGGTSPGCRVSLQDAHPCGGHHGDGTGGQLHGLGQAPATQGRGQNAYAAQPAESAAQLCDHRHRRRARQQAGAGAVRRGQEW